MTGFTSTITFDNAEFEQLFSKLSKVNPTEFLAEIGDYQLSQTLLNFDQEQTPDGDAWLPSQRALREGGKTLQNYGHLRDSYTYVVNFDSVSIGSNLVYAAIHHFGGEAGRSLAVEIVQRQALGVTAEDELEYLAIGEDYLHSVVH